jgi:hypothetical protein
MPTFTLLLVPDDFPTGECGALCRYQQGGRGGVGPVFHTSSHRANGKSIFDALLHARTAPAVVSNWGVPRGTHTNVWKAR